MRILLILLLLTGGCSVPKLPQKGIFSETLLLQQNQNRTQLIVYSKSGSWKSEASYNYILLNDEHVSTINQDTFALLQVTPGMYNLRVTQHGYESVELPRLFLVPHSPGFKSQFEDTIELNIEPDRTTFVSINIAEKVINYQCKETETSIKICTSIVEGVVLSIEQKELAVATLKGLHEVCHDCK